MRAYFCPHCMKTVTPETQTCPRCGKNVEAQGEPYQLEVGTVLTTQTGKAYLVGMCVGSGGFGMTYIGKDLNNGTRVAIKEYFPSRLNPFRQRDGSLRFDSQYMGFCQSGINSLLREARMLHELQNIPSVVRVVDYFQANNTAYMVMEYLDGNTLRSVIESGRRLRPDGLLRRMVNLLRDLDHLHQSGVIHRDIAPDNIMLMQDGTLKLMDFGCARFWENGKSLTAFVKVGFAPPEQYGSRGQGPFTDIYALCATIYYCLSGIIPPPAPERAEAAYRGKPDPLLSLREQGCKITQLQEKLILWGLCVRSGDRPPSAGMLANALDHTLPDPKTQMQRPHQSEALEPDGTSMQHPHQSEQLKPDDPTKNKMLIHVLSIVGELVLIGLFFFLRGAAWLLLLAAGTGILAFLNAKIRK